MEAVGVKPESLHLKELLRRVIDSESEVEAKRKIFDSPDASYEVLFLEHRIRLMTVASQFAYVAQGRDKPDVAVGISNLNTEFDGETPSLVTPQTHLMPTENPEEPDTNLNAPGKGNGNGHPTECNRCKGKDTTSWHVQRHMGSRLHVCVMPMQARFIPRKTAP